MNLPNKLTVLRMIMIVPFVFFIFVFFSFRKKIYEKQNPKVRDNVIERIEVGAVEVVPNNEYETPVYNENINLIFNGEWQTDVDIYGNVTVEEAKKIVDEMYKDESFTIELINGYAYDTMLTWIKNTNNVEVTELQEKCKTGRNSYNNIYDCFDNIYELSNEETYGSIVVRGFMKDDNFSEEKMDEIRVKEEGCERLSILKEDNFLNLDSILAFRTIIY